MPKGYFNTAKFKSTQDKISMKHSASVYGKKGKNKPYSGALMRQTGKCPPAAVKRLNKAENGTEGPDAGHEGPERPEG